jgi:hypothetical protein
MLMTQTPGKMENMGKGKGGGEGVYSFLTQFWDLRYSLLIQLLESGGPRVGGGGGDGCFCLYVTAVGSEKKHIADIWRIFLRPV